VIAIGAPVVLVACLALIGGMLLFVRQIAATVKACEGASQPDAVLAKTGPGRGPSGGGSGPTGDDAPGPGDPPENFIEAYFEAASQPDAQLGPEGPYVLMAIHKIESGFGRSDADGVKYGVNFANCCKGPFQFYDTRKWSTWNARSSISDEPYGRDGDGDGDVDIYSNHDAMFAAAALLADSGAPASWMDAIWAYNHLESYRQDVLSYARHFEGTIPAPSGFEPAVRTASPEVRLVAQTAGCTGDAIVPDAGPGGGGPEDGGPYSQPLPKRSFMITTPFWTWRGTYNHAGTDLAAPEGTLIRSIGGGTVAVAGVVSGYGNYTCIRHTKTILSCYGHQSKIDVTVGQQVKRGEPIGLVGTTGESTGPHLHFEIWLGSEEEKSRGVAAAVCPANYVGADKTTWCAPDAPGFDAKPG
jgi:hypothetical protein